MQISFWSPLHGKGTTATSIAVALNFALNYDVKCLITHSQYIRSTMEQAFLTGNESESILEFTDNGIDSLQRLVKSGELTGDDFKNYCVNLINNRLDLLSGSKKFNRNLYSQSIGDTIIKIMNKAQSFYDVVFVDLNSGLFDDISKKVLESSDLIIVNLEQNEKMIDDFFKEQIKSPIFKDKNILICISKYDCESKCSKRYISHNFKFSPIYSIPYSTEFLDSINNHETLNFFYTNNKFVKGEEFEFFFNEINKVTDKICELSDSSNSKSTVFKNNLFNIFKKNSTK